jgi:TolB-like protein/Tfp pilus assembly protein PilF
MKIRHISPKIVITLLYYGRNIKTGTIQKLVYQFNQFTLDTALYCLYESGNRISIEPQVFDLLVYLIENRDRVVTRDEALENLWKGKVVTDSALGVGIKEARKAVGDNGDRQGVIRTLHGRGYQFIAEITELAVGKSPEKTEPLASQEAFSLPDKPSIAVLPFQNMSDDPEQEYFADGMSEEIITTLSRIPDLVVIARHSTFVYKGRAVDVRQVGRELGVRHVLEGGIRKNGNQLRITAQLIDAQSGNHVWAERYDRELDEIFTIQDEITHNIVVELQVKLVTGEYTRLWASGTNSIEAWELVTRSRPLFDSLVREDAMAGKQLLDRALKLDDNYSSAWTMLGWLYWQESVYKWGSEPEKSLQMAFEAAQKALSADTYYPAGYSLLGSICMVRGDTKQAIAMSEKAVELAPSDSLVLALLGNVLVDSGRLKEGIQKIQRAIRLCPFFPAWYLIVLGAGLHLNGDNEAAISALEHATERESTSHFSRLWLASALVEVRKLDEARVISKAVLDIEPNFSAANWAKNFSSKSHERLKDNLLTAGFPE